MIFKKYGDLAAGIFFFVLSVALFVAANALPPSLMGGLGSDFMPKILAIVTCILSFFQIRAGFHTMRTYQPAQEAEEDILIDFVLCHGPAHKTFTASPPRARFAAATKARNRGWARLGRDLNSGWNWTARNQGWFGSSTISTRVPSGDRPERTSPAPVRAAR